MDLVAIAAVAENGVIARNGEIPWDHPADKRFYRETIVDHPIIVGRTTYDGSPRPGSTNIVLTSRDLEVPEGVIVAHSVGEAIEAAEETGAETTYVIGGQGVYESFMPYLDRLLITHVPGEYEGDRWFPDWNDDDWTPVERIQLTEELVVVRYRP
jgi:dihydrofolate reductase